MQALERAGEGLALEPPAPHLHALSVLTAKQRASTPNFPLTEKYHLKVVVAPIVATTRSSTESFPGHVGRLFAFPDSAMRPDKGWLLEARALPCVAFMFVERASKRVSRFSGQWKITSFGLLVPVAEERFWVS